MKNLFLFFLLNVSYLFCNLDFQLAQADQKVGKLYQYDLSVMEAFDKFSATLQAIAKKDPSFPTQKLLDAFVFAAEKHKNDADQNKLPIIIKLTTICNTLYHEGKIHSPNILIASLLKDTKNNQDVEILFGSRVQSIIKEVNTEKDLSNMSMDGQLISLSQKIHERSSSKLDEGKSCISYSWINENLNNKLK